MKKRLIAVILTGCMALAGLMGCAAAGGNTTPVGIEGEDGGKESEETGKAEETETGDRGEKIKVVCTIFPQYDWVRQIAGDHVDLTLLLDGGTDLHSYQATTEDIVAISNCDVLIYVGGESDVWVEDALTSAVNQDMKVIKLMDILKDSVKSEELKEGMEHNHDHNHGPATFEDSEVQDRELSDWYGDWQSIYPYLLDGTLEPVMEHKAEESGDMTAEQYYDYYKTGYETDVERIVIEGNTFEFFQNGTSCKGEYEYKGYRIFTYESGSKGVRYQFEAVGETNGAPKYIQFSDHEIAPAAAEHFHIYFGDEGFDALSEEMNNWPTYFPGELDAEGILHEMLDHDHSHEEELDEHVWLSLKNAKSCVRFIADALAEVDSENGEAYAANGEAYAGELDALDQEYADMVSGAAVKTLVFGDRFPFRYLTDDYGLDYFAAFSGCSAETEASFDTIIFLASKIDELGLKNIFTIDNSNGSIAQTVAESTKAKNQNILTLDSMQSVSAADVEGGTTYLSLMRNNLEILTEALSK